METLEQLINKIAPETGRRKVYAWTPDLSKPCLNHGELPTNPPEGTTRTFATFYQNTRPDPSHDAIPSGLDASEIGFLAKASEKAGIGSKRGKINNQMDEHVKHIRSRVFVKKEGEGGTEDSLLQPIESSSMTNGLQGLFSYVHLCWAREKSIILTPDMIWMTVLSELARDSVSNPETYRPLFAPSSSPGGQKETLIQLTGDVTEISTEVIASQLSSKVASQQFFDMVSKNHFGASSLPGFSRVAASVLSSAASPFYNYVTFRCGIPFVSLGGTQEDWEKLSQCVGDLSGHLPTKEAQPFKMYLERVKKRVDEIVHYGFIEEDMRKSSVFFAGIYWISKSCGSGAPYYTRGWLYEFAFRNNNFQGNRDSPPCSSSYFSNVVEFPCHINIVPWKNLETDRAFVKCAGLFYAEETDEYFVPRYGEFVYEQLKTIFE